MLDTVTTEDTVTENTGITENPENAENTGNPESTGTNDVQRPAADERPLKGAVSPKADALTGMAGGSEESATSAPTVGDARATDEPSEVEAEAAPAPKKRGRPKKNDATTRKGQLTVTLTGTADGGDWQVDVVQGTKRVVSKLAVPGASVAAAAAELHEDVAQAVDTVLSAAREQQQRRVEQLEAELRAAQEALAHLDGGDAGSTTSEG